MREPNAQTFPIIRVYLNSVYSVNSGFSTETAHHATPRLDRHAESLCKELEVEQPSCFFHENCLLANYLIIFQAFGAGGGGGKEDINNNYMQWEAARLMALKSKGVSQATDNYQRGQ